MLIVVMPCSSRWTRLSSPVMMIFLNESFTLVNEACSCCSLLSLFMRVAVQHVLKLIH